MLMFVIVLGIDCNFLILLFELKFANFLFLFFTKQYVCLIFRVQLRGFTHPISMDMQFAQTWVN